MLEFNIFIEKKLIQRVLISKSPIMIGRSVDNDIVLRSEHVSRHHVIIHQQENQFFLEDKSTNGLLLDSERVTGLVRLPSKCRMDIYPFHVECLQQQDNPTVLLPKEDRVISPENKGVMADPFQISVISSHYGTLVGEGTKMQQIYRLIDDVANSPATVLIRGECGTGKELVARAIHEASPRRQKPFMALNCAAVPLDLIESELFGYEKGAFTGASIGKKGKVDEADGGTLFLDEIGELSMAAQAKLLRFLQNKTFMRLGGLREISVDVRLLAATNKDLEQAICEETFRSDLYYRINVFPLYLPPLRERAEDIPLLVTHIIKRLMHELQLPSEPVITIGAMDQMKQAKWPGNIRQLENLLYSAVIRAQSSRVIDEALLTSASPTWTGAQNMPQETPLETLTKQMLLDVLKQTNGDTAKAAEILKVSRGTIYYKLKKYGLQNRTPL